MNAIRFSEENFKKKIEIVNHFISYHLMEFDDMLRNYSSDWSIKAASRVMALLSKYIYIYIYIDIYGKLMIRNNIIKCFLKHIININIYIL